MWWHVSNGCRIMIYLRGISWQVSINNIKGYHLTKGYQFIEAYQLTKGYQPTKAAAHEQPNWDHIHQSYFPKNQPAYNPCALRLLSFSANRIHRFVSPYLRIHRFESIVMYNAPLKFHRLYNASLELHRLYFPKAPHSALLPPPLLVHLQPQFQQPPSLYHLCILQHIHEFAHDSLQIAIGGHGRQDDVSQEGGLVHALLGGEEGRGGGRGKGGTVVTLIASILRSNRVDIWGSQYRGRNVII